MNPGYASSGLAASSREGIVALQSQIRFRHCLCRSRTLTFSIPLFMSFPYLDLFDSNHRLFGTHYCGPGGGGAETGQLDHLCHVHDDCYRQFGVNANANSPGHHTGLDDSKVQGMAMCNQALYNGAGDLPWSYGAYAIRAWLKHGFGFLYPGTESQ
jgi:hypothetical protein